MNTSTELNELYAALAKAQGDIESAKKDSKNPFFNSTYADLASVWDACRKPLAANGLSIVQVMNDEGTQLITRLCHSSGQWTEGSMPVTPKKTNDSQAHGSALTYARRYGLMAICGISPSEDDGNAATAPPKTAQPKTTQPKTTQPKPSAVDEVRALLKDAVGCKTAEDFNAAVRFATENKHHAAECKDPKIAAVVLEAMRTTNAHGVPFSKFLSS